MTNPSALAGERFRLVRFHQMPQHDLVAEARVTISIRSNGVILMKREIRLAAVRGDAGPWHDEGWREQLGAEAAKAQGITPEVARDAYLKNGYTLCGEGT